MSYKRAKVMRALKARGFEGVREGRQHTMVANADGKSIAIPRHRDLARGTVRGIAKDAGADWDEFSKEIT